MHPHTCKPLLLTLYLTTDAKQVQLRWSRRNRELGLWKEPGVWLWCPHGAHCANRRISHNVIKPQFPPLQSRLDEGFFMICLGSKIMWFFFHVQNVSVIDINKFHIRGSGISEEIASDVELRGGRHGWQFHTWRGRQISLGRRELQRWKPLQGTGG